MIPDINAILDSMRLDSTQSSDGTDKRTLHSYVDSVYQPLINSTFLPKSILEIGTFRGGSLALWTQCFPKSHVTSIDINISNLRNRLAINALGAGKATLIEGDAYSNSAIMKGTYDWIIDDGPHTLHSQEIALSFVRFLNTPGILIIEDIPFSLTHIRRLFNIKFSINDLEIFFIPLFLKKGRFDDCVLIVARGISIGNVFHEGYYLDEMSNHRFFFMYLMTIVLRPISLFRSKAQRLLHKKIQFKRTT